MKPEDVIMGEYKKGKGNLYALVNQQYFKEPRHVCIVDEINPLPANRVELFAFPPIDRELRWLASLGLVASTNNVLDEYGRVRIVARVSHA